CQTFPLPISPRAIERNRRRILQSCDLDTVSEVDDEGLRRHRYAAVGEVRSVGPAIAGEWRERAIVVPERLSICRSPLDDLRGVGQIDEPNHVRQVARYVLQNEELANLLRLQENQVRLRAHEHAFPEWWVERDCEDAEISGCRLLSRVRPEQRLIAVDGHKSTESSLL